MTGLPYSARCDDDYETYLRERATRRSWKADVIGIVDSRIVTLPGQIGVEEQNSNEELSVEAEVEGWLAILGRKTDANEGGSGGGVKTVKMKPCFAGLVKEHQRSVVRFAWRRIFTVGEGGCVIAHGMGLGKTIDAITLLATFIHMYESHGMRAKVVYILPPGVVGGLLVDMRKFGCQFEIVSSNTDAGGALCTTCVPTHKPIPVYQNWDYSRQCNKTLQHRHFIFEDVCKWHKTGGVLLLSDNGGQMQKYSYAAAAHEPVASDASYFIGQVVKVYVVECGDYVIENFVLGVVSDILKIPALKLKAKNKPGLNVVVELRNPFPDTVDFVIKFFVEATIESHSVVMHDVSVKWTVRTHEKYQVARMEVDKESADYIATEACRVTDPSYKHHKFQGALIVVDEAHLHLKANSTRSRSLRTAESLAATNKKSGVPLFLFATTKRVLMTGTPIQNKLDELWDLMLLVRRRSGFPKRGFSQLEVPDIKTFRELFVLNGTGGELQRARDAVIRYRFVDDFIDYKNQAYIFKYDLPERFEFIINVRMNALQKIDHRALYASTGTVKTNGAIVDERQATDINIHPDYHLPWHSKLYQYAVVDNAWAGGVAEDEMANRSHIVYRVRQKPDKIVDEEDVCVLSDDEGEADIDSSSEDSNDIGRSDHKQKKSENVQNKTEANSDYSTPINGDDSVWCLPPDVQSIFPDATTMTHETYMNLVHGKIPNTTKSELYKIGCPVVYRLGSETIWRIGTVQECYKDTLLKSPKLMVAVNLVRACVLRGERVVVMCTMKRPLYYIQTQMVATRLAGLTWTSGMNYAVVCGDDINRHEVIQDMNNVNTTLQVVFLTKGVGSTGITLNAFSRMILLDVDWNPAKDQQCMGRIYRYGQQKPVVIYRLVMSDTMEVNKMKLQQQKLITAISVLSGSNDNVQSQTKARVCMSSRPVNPALTYGGGMGGEVEATPRFSDRVLVAALDCGDADSVTSLFCAQSIHSIDMQVIPKEGVEHAGVLDNREVQRYESMICRNKPMKTIIPSAVTWICPVCSALITHELSEECQISDGQEPSSTRQKVLSEHVACLGCHSVFKITHNSVASYRHLLALTPTQSVWPVGVLAGPSNKRMLCKQKKHKLRCPQHQHTKGNALCQNMLNVSFDGGVSLRCDSKKSLVPVHEFTSYLCAICRCNTVAVDVSPITPGGCVCCTSCNLIKNKK